MDAISNYFRQDPTYRTLRDGDQLYGCLWHQIRLILLNELEDNRFTEWEWRLSFLGALKEMAVVFRMTSAEEVLGTQMFHMGPERTKRVISSIMEEYVYQKMFVACFVRLCFNDDSL